MNQLWWEQQEQYKYQQEQQSVMLTQTKEELWQALVLMGVVKEPEPECFMTVEIDDGQLS